MRLSPWLATAALFAATVANAQSPAPAGVAGADTAQATAQPMSPRMLLPLPEEEDWSFLDDRKQRTDLFDPVKRVRLGKGVFLSLGGEAREFLESITNEGFVRPGTNTYHEERLLAHADLSLGENVRVFAETQTALIGARAGGPRPSVDRDAFDLLEGFVELKSRAIDATLHAPVFVARFGRQQLDFGGGRLVSSREGPFGDGPNALQAFDIARVIVRHSKLRVDLIGGWPVDVNPGVFDNRAGRGQTIAGAYAQYGGFFGDSKPHFDAYYFRTTRPNAAFFLAQGNERRDTLGLRAYRQNTAFDYDVEAFHQGGRVGAKSIDAWGFDIEGGYTFAHAPWSPRIGARLGANSGGGNATTARNAYVPFPRGVYFGQLGAIGPENTGGVQPNLTLKPAKSLTLSGGVFFFWRRSLADGIYGLPGFPLLPPANAQRFIGYQPEIVADWQAARHVVIGAAYDSFEKGDFLNATPGARAIRYANLFATFRF